MGIPKPTKEEVEQAEMASREVGEIAKAMGRHAEREQMKNNSEIEHLEDDYDELDDPDEEPDDFETEHPEIRRCKAGIRNRIDILRYCYDRKDWPGIIKTAEKIIWRAEQIQKILSKEEGK